MFSPRFPCTAAGSFTAGKVVKVMPSFRLSPRCSLLQLVLRIYGVRAFRAVPFRALRPSVNFLFSEFFANGERFHIKSWSASSGSGIFSLSFMSSVICSIAAICCSCVPKIELAICFSVNFGANTCVYEYSSFASVSSAALCSGDKGQRFDMRRRTVFFPISA